MRDYCCYTKTFLLLFFNDKLEAEFVLSLEFPTQNCNSIYNIFLPFVGIGLGLAESGRLFPVSLPSQVKTHRGGVGYWRRDSPAMTEGFEVAAAAAEDSQSETALAAFGAAQPRFEVTVGADGRVVVSPVAALKKRPPQHRVNGSGDFAYPSPPPPTMTPPPSPSKYEVRVVEGRVTVTETPGTDGRHRFSEELEWRKAGDLTNVQYCSF